MYSPVFSFLLSVLVSSFYLSSSRALIPVSIISPFGAVFFSSTCVPFVTLLSSVYLPLFRLRSQELRRQVCEPFSYATASVPFPLSCIRHLRRTSSTSLLVSLIRLFPLSAPLSRYLSPLYSLPLHLSVLLYTHCKDLGNEVDPPPRPAIHHPPSSTISHLPPPLKAWRGCYADRNSI